MNFRLERGLRGPNGIFGDMVGDDGSVYFTLEHAYLVDGQWVPKVAAGEYDCELYDSPEHGTVFVVKNVPPFLGRQVSYIEIHVGCFDHDSEGCILLGLSRTPSDEPTMVLHSRDAFSRFMASQSGVKEFRLTIAD